jgi:hypothetical protein
VKTDSSCPMHETINLGTSKNPKTVNLGKMISKEEIKALLALGYGIKQILRKKGEVRTARKA